MLFSIVVAPICIPPTVSEGSFISDSLQHLSFVDFLMMAIIQREVISRCSFDLHFSLIIGVSFSCVPVREMSV